MSTKGFFESIIRVAQKQCDKCAISKKPRYTPIKTGITEALTQLEIAIKYDEISKSDGLIIKNQLNKIYNSLCMLPEIRKKGLRQ